jgi:CHAT domain-containing protein
MKRSYLLFFLLFFFNASASFAQEYKKYLALDYVELDSLVMIPYGKGDYNTCLSFMMAAREKAISDFGEMDSIYAEYTSNVGFFYSKMGKYKAAETFLLDGKTIIAQVLGKDHPRYAISLSNLSSLYENMNKYVEAENLLIEALKITAKTLGKEHSSYAENLNDLAILYYKMGNYEKAEPLFLETKAIQANALGEEHFSFANSLNNLASLYQKMGNYEQAEPLLLQAKRIRIKTKGAEHPAVADVLNNLGTLYHRMGDTPKALTFFLQSKDMYEKTMGKKHPKFSQSLSNLAVTYQKMGNYEEAKSLYLQAKDIYKERLGENHYSFAKNLANLASLYYDMGKYEQAETLQLQAKDIYKKAFGEKHPSFARSLNNLAQNNLAQGRLDRALDFCQQGIVARCEKMDSSFSDWVNLDQFTYSTDAISYSIKTLLSILYAQYKETGEKSKLEFHYAISQTGIRMNERVRNEFSGEGDKLRSLAENNDLVLMAINTVIELKSANFEEKAFGFAEMNKGILLLDAAKTERAYLFGDLPDSLAKEEQALQKKYTTLKANLVERRPPIEMDSLNSIMVKLNEEIKDFTKILKVKYPKYIALKYKHKSASAKDIQNTMDDKTALLEYVIGDSVLYIFYIDKEQIKIHDFKINYKDLKKRIKSLHHSLSNYDEVLKKNDLAYREYADLAYWFYANLVAPALKNRKDLNQLIIVTDGELGHLPFEAFLVEPATQKKSEYQGLHYLIKDYSISYNFSATLWKAHKTKAKNKNNGQILAMASNYDIQPDTSKTAWRLPSEERMRGHLVPLPSARREVQALERTFKGFFGFDDLASEKVFKAKAGDYAVIHLAMHGLLDPKTPILSSLAFTEEGDSLENNFIHSYEISKMKLKADLVVLSACETGYGRFEKGNGITSLAQAFTYAGAPAMIVSLWQVNDYVTSEIMKTLYNNLADGMPKDKALRAAKLAYIESVEDTYAHPAFWSAFIQIGNTAPIHIERKVNWMAWGMGLGVLVLLGAGWFLRKRKQEETV